MAREPDDPGIVQEPDCYGQLYAYYGYSPFRGTGYRYPGFPFYQ